MLHDQPGTGIPALAFLKRFDQDAKAKDTAPGVHAVMPHRPRKRLGSLGKSMKERCVIGRKTIPGRYRLILVVSLLLTAGFLATTLASYHVSKAAIRDAIVANELPLTSDTIYSEIQRDLIRPVLVSSTMAQDTFLRDWILAGEQDEAQIVKYLDTIRQNYGAFTSFLVSEKSRRYYQAKGVLKTVHPDEVRDAWYFRVRTLKEDYEINVDPDMANADSLTIFINYRVLDYHGHLLGATGVGLRVDAVSRLLHDYRARFGRSVYLLDANGKVMLADGTYAISDIHQVEGLADIAAQILTSRDSARFQYHKEGATHLLNVRYIPDLKWFLCVEKVEDEALGEIRQTLWLNLAIFAVVTATILTLVSITVHRYHHRMLTLAVTDSLTGLFNRRAFDLHLEQGIEEARRKRQPLAAIMIDIDHFKRINDEHGHLAGDQVLQKVSALVRGMLRHADLACRWGGEELFVLLKDSDAAAALTVAEKIRTAVEHTHFGYQTPPLTVTVSVGVAIYPENTPVEDNASMLIARADAALYRAKQQGRNRVCLAEPFGHIETNDQMA